VRQRPQLNPTNRRQTSRPEPRSCQSHSLNATKPRRRHG
jgi:hypothetical protein